MNIGKYEILFPLNNFDKVLILKEGAEQGEFNKDDLFKKLEKVIDEFFKENM